MGCVPDVRNIQGTEEGELFLQYANQILDLVNRSEEDVRERKEGLQGTLYIASVEGCGPIDEYTSGEELLRQFSAGRYDLIFLDIYMGGMSGVETAKR